MPERTDCLVPLAALARGLPHNAAVCVRGREGATERDCMAPWRVLFARRLHPLARCLPHNAAVGVRCRVWGGSLSEAAKAWQCKITPIGNTPPFPLLLLGLTIDPVACGQVCFGVGHFELVPAGRVESQYVLAVRFALGLGTLSSCLLGGLNRSMLTRCVWKAV